MQDYREILTDMDVSAAQALLDAAGLRLPEGRTFGLGFYEDGRMVACGFLAHQLICGICVDNAAQAGGTATGLLSRLVLHGREQGLGHFFLFTKAQEAWKFAAAGFDLVAKTSRAALLEQGRPNYADWLRELRRGMTKCEWGGTSPGEHPIASGSPPDGSQALGAIVMNANPFTRGHDYLARTAAQACARLLVFVVEEEASAFPFAVRLELVRQGLADVDNILVLPSGPYMVSRSSFPAYFTADAEKSVVHATLDCTIFASRIASDIGIGCRFVGTEPFDSVTAAYNDVMHTVFAQHTVALRELPRLATTQGAVSASTVRALLQQEPTQENARILATLLPAVTLEYLHSNSGVKLRNALKHHAGRH